MAHLLLDSDRKSVFGQLRAAYRDRRVAISTVMLVIAFFLALFAPLVAPHDPYKLGVGPRLETPSAQYLFGTDVFGRDVLSRAIFGTRISIGVSILVAVGALGVGFPLGIATGYSGGFLDHLIGRISDVMFAFPTIILALVLMTILNPSLNTAILALAIIYIPTVIRFVRGCVLAEKNQDYVLAARIVGASVGRIMFRHIAPNVLSPTLVMGSVIMAWAILSETSLSFLGVGAQPPTPSLGRMVMEASQTYSIAPHLSVMPALVITYLVMAFNLLGDGLRDLLDPRIRKSLK